MFSGRRKARECPSIITRMKRIFVSSTFSDFHEERDLLRNMIMPMVNKVAKEYGESISFCDLRWGIDTSKEDSEERVLSVCMDEIDKSRPHMLVLLGEKYGYVPTEKAIADETKKRGLHLSDLEISITQLEIEYGALHNSDSLANTWFFFRENNEISEEAESVASKNQLKLKELKKRIIQLGGDRVLFYSVGEDKEVSYQKWCDKVYNCLISDFLVEWKAKENVDLHMRECINQWSMLQDKARYFKARKSFADEVMFRIRNNDDESEIFTIFGDAGAGKSTCLCYICEEIEKMGMEVLPLLCGSTPLSTNEEGILRHFVWVLEKKLQLPHMEESDSQLLFDYTLKEDNIWHVERESIKKHSQYQNYQSRLFQLYDLFEQAGKKLLLAIDAVDQIKGIGDIRNFVVLPRKKYTHLKFLLTTTKKSEISNDICSIQLPELQDTDKKLIIDQVLDKQGKKFSKEVYDYLCHVNGADNPLYLYLVINYFCMMNKSDYQIIGQSKEYMEGINLHQLKMIESFPQSLNRMAAITIKKATMLINDPAIERIIELMALSREFR